MPQVPLPYPADIMIRERAILINVEAIRMIITKDLVPTSHAPKRMHAGPVSHIGVSSCRVLCGSEHKQGRCLLPLRQWCSASLTRPTTRGPCAGSFQPRRTTS